MRKVKARQYGSLIIDRGICLWCGGKCLVCKDRTSSCCSGPVDIAENGNLVKEVTTAGFKRKIPPLYWRKAILDRQYNKCYWCGREFGTYVLSPKGNAVFLKVVWDHYLPYFYSGSCIGSDFVAACSRCNSHKSAKIVYDIEGENELKDFLKRRWYHGGWKDLQ